MLMRKGTKVKPKDPDTGFQPRTTFRHESSGRMAGQEQFQPSPIHIVGLLSPHDRSGP